MSGVSAALAEGARELAVDLAVDLVAERGELRVAAEFVVGAGRPLALVGPNGAGKTTVLHALAGHVPIVSGGIRLRGGPTGERDLGALVPERRRIGVVFQDFLLFPHLTVADNVAYGVRMTGAGRRSARETVAPWLQRFDLAGLAARYPHELSGGQAQRVALARALAADPEALLLDEPMASLDVEVRDEVRAELSAHLRDFAGPTVIVTHSAADVVALAAEVAVLERGTITQRGTWAELVAAPATDYVRRLTELRGE
ncbi:ATP-binding cassette domain-containing protein [Lysinimonas soli]|uniref:ATP-binding cassette domain-containing protein n=1 Tax=Lysinimonas soli TaxID=1074233 RepID=A0ABW0NU71_9MICO